MLLFVVTLASRTAGETGFVYIFFCMCSKMGLVLSIVCVLYIDVFYFGHLSYITYGWKQVVLSTRLTNIDELLDLLHRIKQ